MNEEYQGRLLTMIQATEHEHSEDPEVRIARMHLGRGDVVPMIQQLLAGYQEASDWGVAEGMPRESAVVRAFGAVVLSAIEIGFDWRGVVDTEDLVDLDLDDAA